MIILSTICKIHGYTEDTVKNRHECRLCAYRRHKEWRGKEENRIKVVEWAKRHQAEHPETQEKVRLKLKLKNLTLKKERIVLKIAQPSVNCSKHGFTFDVRDTGKKRKFGNPIYTCRLCHNEQHRRYTERKKRVPCSAYS